MVGLLQRHANQCGMANNLKFECPNTVNRKIGTAKGKYFFSSYCNVNNSVNGKYKSGEQVNTSCCQYDSHSNNQGKNVNINSFSFVSSKYKNIILPVGSLEWCVNQWMVACPSRYILSVFQGG